MTINSVNEIQRDLNVHILSVSAQLVGICLTVIGLLRVIVRLKVVDTIADSVLAVDAMASLAACVFAYASLGSRTTRRRRALERIAVVSFGAGLGLMPVVCALIAWRLV